MGSNSILHLKNSAGMQHNLSERTETTIENVSVESDNISKAKTQEFGNKTTLI